MTYSWRTISQALSTKEFNTQNKSLTFLRCTVLVMTSIEETETQACFGKINLEV